MDLEKDGIWNFEAATLCGNSRKNPSSGLSRADERQVGSFGSAAQKGGTAKSNHTELRRISKKTEFEIFWNSFFRIFRFRRHPFETDQGSVCC